MKMYFRFGTSFPLSRTLQEQDETVSPLGTSKLIFPDIVYIRDIDQWFFTFFCFVDP